MPALDVLQSLLEEERQAYERALPRALEMAASLPLVRVIIPRDDQRGIEEIEDVLTSGRLSREHKGLRTRRTEAQLGTGSFLYFHAGRTHPDYGRGMVVIRDSPTSAELEATPFGLGGLCCGGTDEDPLHKARGCVSPVAHHDSGEQARFVAESTWHEDWRDKAAQYLALYFGDTPEAYFSPRAADKPTREDPEGIFTDPRTRDWRAWTIEVRLTEDVDLFDVIRARELLFWGMTDWVYNTLRIDALRQRRSITHIYPLLALLPREGEIELDERDPDKVFSAAQRKIEEAVFNGLE